MPAVQRWTRALLLLAGLAACKPSAASFDYWVLALSWSPEYCASRDADRGSVQCSNPHEFIVHGLWPQFETGYPEFCDTRERVDEGTAERLRPLVPDRDLVFHQWKKHGSCSGLDAETYFATLEKARATVKVPSAYLRSASNRRTSRSLLEKAFLESNPGLPREALAIECRSHYLTEVRVCLDRELLPRACGPDATTVCERELIVRPVGR